VTGAAAAVVGAIALAAATAADTNLHPRVFRFVDASRIARYTNGLVGPRVLVTDVRYPAGAGPFPLIVFCHGFALTPAAYAQLLDHWAAAGFVVAAPAFPVENANAPGGPSRTDLANEPRDVSFVITRVLRALGPIVDPRAIAVAGQSDGGVTALSVAYDARYRDDRIDAAIVMSGSPLSGFVGAPRGSPPLLALQGTADPFNSAATTAAYFRDMRRPKFLVWLLGATHLPPYTTRNRWSPVVDAATTAFLQHFLVRAPLRRLLDAGYRMGVARLVAQP
jgi:dienelactone hydrolase